MRLINSSVAGRLAIILLLGASLSLTGCSGFGGGKGGYDQSKAGRSLEVPPDLTAPQTDQTYAVPGETARASAATAATAQPSVSPQPRAAAGEIEPDVLPQYSEIRVASEGAARWIEVLASAEALWPQLEAFWDDQGVPLERNEPELGVMETHEHFDEKVESVMVRDLTFIQRDEPIRNLLPILAVGKFTSSFTCLLFYWFSLPAWWCWP